MIPTGTGLNRQPYGIYICFNSCLPELAGIPGFDVYFRVTAIL